MGCHFLLQRTFPTQGSNLHLLHWQVDSSPVSHQEVPGDGGWDSGNQYRDVLSYTVGYRSKVPKTFFQVVEPSQQPGNIPEELPRVLESRIYEFAHQHSLSWKKSNFPSATVGHKLN